MITKRLKEAKFIHFPSWQEFQVVTERRMDRRVVQLTKRETLAFIMFALDNMELTDKQWKQIDVVIALNKPIPLRGETP